jgi:prepilin-type N-terminal cleavage/methylation domain-containing protein
MTERNKTDPARGVTLVEVIVVIAIIGITSVAAVASFARLSGLIQLWNSANMVKSALWVAQTRAISDPRVHCGVSFEYAAGKYSLLTYFDNNNTNKYDASPSPPDGIYQNFGQFPKGITYDCTGITDSTYVFRGDGSVKNGGRIIISNPRYNLSKTITVTKTTGNAKIQ